jgi:antitoxin component YwqK of YwqJK toxin-antitoxin module
MAAILTAWMSGAAVSVVCFVALRHGDYTTFFALVAVALVLAGLWWRERFSRAARLGLLSVLVSTTALFGKGIADIARWNIKSPPEWDFLGFWLHARSAVHGLDFYDPRNAQVWARSLSVSSEFRTEIIDVGFWYPPPSMFLFLPLGWFSQRGALIFWHALHLGLLGLAVLLLWQLFFKRKDWIGLAACSALAVLAYGTRSTMSYAQTTFAALVAVLGFWRFRDRPFGGVWLAAALFVKPLLGFLILGPLLARRWRVVATFAGAAAALLVASAVAFGSSTFTHYFAPTGHKPAWIYSELTNQSALGFFLRRTEAVCLGAECVMNPWFVVTALLIGGITVALVVRLSRGAGQHGEWSVALLLTCALIIYPVSQVFYSVLLLPVWLLIFRSQKRRVDHLILVLLCFGLCSVNGGTWTFGAYLITWIVLVLDVRSLGVCTTRPFTGSRNRAIAMGLALLAASSFACNRKGSRQEKYPNGTVKSRGYVKQDAQKNYVLEGLWTYWHPNGQKAAEGEYRDARQDGKRGDDGLLLDGRQGSWTLWYDNGQKQEEGHYANGKRVGHWTFWRINGQKAGEGSYANGEQAGDWMYWYTNGQKTLEGHYADGKRVGAWTFWRANGHKQEEGYYTNGKRADAWTFWHTNGQKAEAGHYANGRRAGAWTFWYENGQKSFEGYYENGEKVGDWTHWHDSGQKQEEGHYENGARVGDWMRWRKDGAKE